ncbi:unnamed protein product [Fraxinus pennsylvanica]|uniref:Uncharacterized protein n=1 Tax=Fraxinus pennsylvanica TaxID=56036 RepID=A0AAD2A4K4_9LAMI|nr:unnamed protein product [Fraxinus pennsylvanica]
MSSGASAAFSIRSDAVKPMVNYDSRYDGSRFESSLMRLVMNALQGVESALITIDKLSAVLCYMFSRRNFSLNSKHKLTILYLRYSIMYNHNYPKYNGADFCASLSTRCFSSNETWSIANIMQNILQSAMDFWSCLIGRDGKKKKNESLQPAISKSGAGGGGGGGAAGGDGAGAGCGGGFALNTQQNKQIRPAVTDGASSEKVLEGKSSSKEAERDKVAAEGLSSNESTNKGEHSKVLVTGDSIEIPLGVTNATGAVHKNLCQVS